MPLDRLTLWQQLWLRIAACMVERPDGLGDLVSLENLLRPACHRVEELRELEAEMRHNPALAADPTAQALRTELQQLLAALAAARDLLDRMALANPPDLSAFTQQILEAGVQLVVDTCAAEPYDADHAAMTIHTLSAMVPVP